MVQLPILHFNDVYRVRQTDKKGTIGADQFAAKIGSLKKKYASLAHETSTGSGLDGASSEPSSLVLFSGDLFNPSVESSVTRGTHMCDVINACAVDCAVLGNHDLDFGFPHFQTLIKQTNFPWLCTNLADRPQDVEGKASQVDDTPLDDDQQLEGTFPFWTTELNEVKIGVIGLVEKDWLATCPSLPPSFRYRSMAKRCRQLSELLRDPAGPHKCDIIIALTHARLPNDIDLALEVGAIHPAPADAHGADLLLGGHDHVYWVGSGASSFEGQEFDRGGPGTEKDGNGEGQTKCMLVKSGTDFRSLSELVLEVSDRDDKAVRRRTVKSMKVTRHETKPEDPTEDHLKQLIDDLLERVSASTEEAVCFTLTPWDTRSDKARTDESAIGNFLADIILRSYEDPLAEKTDHHAQLSDLRPEGCRQIDCALLCGGTLRGDSVYGPGNITLRHVLEILPFEDPIICKILTGQDIWDTLENAVGAYPKQEGRFPVIAGLAVKWDSRRPSGNRLISVDLLDDVHMLEESEENGNKVKKVAQYEVTRHQHDEGYTIEVQRPVPVKREPLQLERKYRVVTREYMAQGHDGFEALTRGEYIIDDENGVLASTLVRKFLLGASYLWRLKRLRSAEVRSEDLSQSSSTLDSEATSQAQEEGYSTLSLKTRAAVERARFLAQQGGLGAEENDIQSTVAGVAGSPPSTPGRKDPNLYRASQLFRPVVDSSPGGIRDALRAGGAEHHSARDPVTQRFVSGASRPSRPHSRDPSTAAQEPSAADRTRSQGVKRSATAGTITRSVEVVDDEVEELKSASEELAIICPLRDGRLIDVAREGKAEDR